MNEWNHSRSMLEDNSEVKTWDLLLVCEKGLPKE